MKLILNDKDKFQKTKICPPKSLAKINLLRVQLKEFIKFRKNVIYFINSIMNRGLFNKT